MTVRKTITLTDKQDNWIKAQIESGDYTNDSEDFRDLIRRDQERNGKFQALKSAIQEGLDSASAIALWAKSGPRPKRATSRAMARFRLSSRCESDLAEIADYTIEAFGVEQARNYIEGRSSPAPPWPW